MFNPVKVGFKGVKIIKACFGDEKGAYIFLISPGKTVMGTH